jgi:hypothetical protein
MAATFDQTLPTPKDRMRHLVGDTDMANPLRQDETYLALLVQYSETGATEQMAIALAAQYGQMPDTFSDDGTAVSWKDRVKTWLELAARMRTALNEMDAKTGAALRVIKPISYCDLENETEYRRPMWVNGPGYIE